MAHASTLMSLKKSQESTSAITKRIEDRSRDCLVLVMHYLTSQGYSTTASTLKSEGGTTLSRFESADNIDLPLIMADFEEYYEMKFGKRPRFTRRNADNDEDDDAKYARSSLGKGAEARRRKSMLEAEKRKEQRMKKNGNLTSGVLVTMEKKLDVNTSTSNNENATFMSRSASSPVVGSNKENVEVGINGLSGTNITLQSKSQQPSHPVDHDEVPYMNQRLLKPLPSFGGDADLRALGETITRDILQTSPDVTWDDVVQLNNAKKLLKEAVVMPLKYPQLFTGLLSPWCGILLYGPPGTGKTMLAKAVASECNTTFFNISASSIVSKYRGDSEKLIRVLFELARYHAPSTIFLDEIDSIMSSRGGNGDGGGEHEGSRRMKTELLIQMDGLSKGNEHVFVLAASNLPWDLDPALLRRLEKRVLVPLPDEIARKKMLSSHLGETSSLNLDECAKQTQGYSGADIKLLCKECAMRPVRRLLKKLEELEVTTEDGVVHEEEVKKLMDGNPVTQNDLDDSLACTNKSGGEKLHEKYTKWTSEFGSS